MDQDAINLAKAIRQAETGNKPVAGKSGELKSRYQFLPSTWKSWSKQYLGIDNAPLTLENENKVAYSKIKELKDKGLNPAQIASVWNSGSTKWEGKVGVNKQGVKYDVPLYVNRVYSEYQKIKGVGPATGASLRSQYEQRQPQPPTVQMQRIERQQQGLPVARNENRVEPTFVGGMVREALGGGIAKLGESIRAIPKAIRGEDINKPRYSKYLGKEVSRIGAGFDVTKGLTKENLNALKDSGAVGLEFTSYLPITGVVGKTARAIPTLSKLLVKQAGKVALKRIGMNVVEGTVGTAMYEGARRLQGEKDRGNFFENVAYGGVGGLAFGTLGAGLSRGIRQGRRTLASLGGKIPEDIVTESTQRLKGAWRQLVDNYKDLRTFRNKQAKYGRNIEEVLTDEVLVPEIKEGKVDTQKLLPEVDNRIKAQAEQLSEYAKKFDFMPIKIDEVQKVAEKVIRDTPSLTATGEYRTALNELERRMTGLREIYGETIVPSQLNTIRVEMNKITKAFGGDVFKQDVADAIADAVREKLDNVIQDDAFRRGNAKVGDLINVRKFLQKVDGKQVGGGRFSQAFAGMAGAWAFGGIEKLPVVGDIAGYLVGRELSKQARQYAFGKAGPRTRAILRRMQRKNAIGEEIAQKSAKVEQKLLPARTSSVNKVYGTGKTIELPKRATSTVDKAEMANRALEKIKVGDNIKIDVKEMEVTRKVADGVVAKDDGGIKKFIPKEQLGEQAFGAVAGIQTDEDGNLTFDKKSALAGVAGLAVAKKAGILPKAGVYKGEKDLTTKILKDLEGKTTVSKQYILDATNRGELKQVERDLIRDIVSRKGDTVNVSDFAKKVKAELLPLTTKSPKYNIGDGMVADGKYENIVLPDELRGKVSQYKENVYESPISTLAGNSHYPNSKNYFGHTRIEDMADNKTRRVIEVQSDLYQKGNLEKEMGLSGKFENTTSAQKIKAKREANAKKLQQYNDPTAHFRMIREEIKKASQDGKTKLQFPTGETAMKIEGLGQAESWQLRGKNGANLMLNKDMLNPKMIGETVRPISQAGEDWIITDVLGDGKFKAVPKDKVTRENALNGLEDFKETFDISGKVDTSNPIYKFYEKDVQKYLNKFGGKRVVDEKGVSWIEVPIKKEWAKMPVEAFALFPLFGIGKEKVIEDNDEYTTTKSGLFGNKISVTRKNIPELQPVEKPILEQSRNVIIKKEDINELKAILFGEISNRDISKKELEVRVILNTVLNRVKQNKDRGKDKSVTDVLTQKNQYQAYQGQQYYKYLEGDLDDLGKKKKEELDKIVEKIIAEIESGTFEDNTNGAVFYIHNPDGTITYRSGSLFK